MQTPAIDSRRAARPSSATGFAGMLASVTDPPWNDDGLAADVATISYEHALRTHGRSYSDAAEREPDATAPPSESKKLKTASITIRLSEAECAQVRQRAVEAGLTVSAYLRSCALEVESLRTEVKEAMAQLRNAPGPGGDGRTEGSRRFTAWIGRWFRRSETKRQPMM